MSRGRSLNEYRSVRDRDAARRAGCTSDRADHYHDDPAPGDPEELSRRQGWCPLDGADLILDGLGCGGWACSWDGKHFYTHPQSGELW